MTLSGVTKESRHSVQGEVANWTLVEELEIPGDHPRYFLTRVFDIEIDQWDRIYVGEEQEATILLFDTSGELIRHIGRRGYGPGEFQSPENMGWLGDTLWVTDAGLLRVTFFDTTGSVLGSTRISTPAVPPLRASAPDYLLADGSVAAKMAAPSYVIVRLGQITELPVLRMTRSAEVLDTLARLPVGERWVYLPWGKGNLYIPHPFPRTPHWQASPSGEFMVFVDLPVAEGRSKQTLRIAWRGADGSPSHAIEYPFDAIKLRSSTRDSVVESLARQWSSSAMHNPPPLATARDLIDERVRLPAFYPPVTDLVVGRDSTVWLRREETGRDVVTWDILNWPGRRIAVLEASRKFRIYQAERERVWGILPDDDGVPKVLAYRVLAR